MIPGLVLAFLSGFVALSYEILWYRALSFTSGGTANTFGLLLGAYLLGLALGALAVRRTCRDTGGAARILQLSALFRLSLLANLFGYLVVPCLAWLVSHGFSWKYSLAVVGIAAAGLGTVFPLVSHVAIEPDHRVGRRVSYVYLANILGSTAGSLGTGFLLLDHLSLASTHVLLALLGLALAGVPVALNREKPRTGAVAALAAAVLAAGLFGKAPFDGVYEKLQLKSEYSSARRFAHVVETKSGVITVNERGQIFGGGIYDGAYNTDLHDDKNSIIRCYAIGELQPKATETLMIGLSSGSWATVVANNPAVRRLTIIEINPGYLRLLPRFPEVAGLLSNPKVTIEIDDGRRWLVRNKDRKFDAVIANATFHWRSNATNLLSREFLELIRSRLNPGGCYFYNTTGSLRIAKTGCTVFPHGLMLGNFLAVSDSPIEFDPARLRERLFDYPLGTKTVFDRGSPAEVETLDRVMLQFVKTIQTRRDILDKCPESMPVATDDNMGTEWTEGP